MTSTLNLQMRNSNQITRENPGLTRFHIKGLRAALLEVVGALFARPEPRDVWDDLGRKDSDLRNLWIDKDVLLCRQALTVAATQGPGVLAATVQRVERYFDKKMHVALYGFDDRCAVDLPSMLCEVTREHADVIVAVAEVQRTENEGTLELLLSESIEARRASERVIDLAAHRLAHHQQPVRLARH